MNFCLGKLKSSPWSELDGLQPETKIINEQLGNVNMKGFLTINSQPAVNGEKSDSLSVGEWYICVNICSIFSLVNIQNLENSKTLYLVYGRACLTTPGTVGQYPSLPLSTNMYSAEFSLQHAWQDGVGQVVMFTRRPIWSSFVQKKS